jgi:hypothetical protein
LHRKKEGETGEPQGTVTAAMLVIVSLTHSASKIWPRCSLQTLKQTTVHRYHYGSHAQLKQHLRAFLMTLLCQALEHVLGPHAL